MLEDCRLEFDRVQTFLCVLPDKVDDAVNDCYLMGQLAVDTWQLDYKLQRKKDVKLLCVWKK